LKAQMHIAEVDLNYTQYSPLSEPYISLYPQQKNSPEDSEDGPKADDSQPKPPMWSEVEKCMEEGTLNKLRNRVGDAPATKSRPLEMKPGKQKLQSAPLPDTSGLNRRERRSQQRVQEGGKKGKNKSMGFEKNAIFGASQSVQRNEVANDDDDDSDGGFFEA
jgi:hypothetical protein